MSRHAAGTPRSERVTFTEHAAGAAPRLSVERERALRAADRCRGGLGAPPTTTQAQTALALVRVVSDAIEGYAGPLAGLHAGLSVSKRPYLATVPCDSPFLPLDLVSRLYSHLDDAGAEIAVAKTGGQAHPVFCLVRRGVLDHLTDFLKGGGRKIDAWYSTLFVVEVNFDDRAEAFSNINTLEELQAHEIEAPKSA